MNLTELSAKRLEECKWRGNDLNDDVNRCEKIVQYVISCHAERTEYLQVRQNPVTLSKRQRLQFHQIPIYLKEQKDTLTNFGRNT